MEVREIENGGNETSGLRKGVDDVICCELVNGKGSRQREDGHRLKETLHV